MVDNRITKEWFVVVNDLVGGWAISTIDRNLADQGEWPLAWVAEITSKEVAEHVASIHNRWLRRYSDGL